MIVPTLSAAFAGARTNYFVFSAVRQRSGAKTFEFVPGRLGGISMGMTITNPTRAIAVNDAALLGWFEAAQLRQATCQSSASNFLPRRRSAASC